MTGKKKTLIDGDTGKYREPGREWTGKIFGRW
jgi:hypothetical protein